MQKQEKSRESAFKCVLMITVSQGYTNNFLFNLFDNNACGIIDALVYLTFGLNINGIIITDASSS